MFLDHDRRTIFFYYASQQWLPILVKVALTEDMVIKTEISVSRCLVQAPDEKFMEFDSALSLKPVSHSMVGCVLGTILVGDVLHFC